MLLNVIGNCDKTRRAGYGFAAANARDRAAAAATVSASNGASPGCSTASPAAVVPCGLVTRSRSVAADVVASLAASAAASAAAIG